MGKKEPSTGSWKEVGMNHLGEWMVRGGGEYEIMKDPTLHRGAYDVRFEWPKSDIQNHTTMGYYLIVPVSI